MTNTTNPDQFSAEQKQAIEKLVAEKFKVEESAMARAIIVEAVGTAIHDATEILNGKDWLEVLHDRFANYDLLKTKLESHKGAPRFWDVAVEYWSSFLAYNQALSILETPNQSS